MSELRASGIVSLAKDAAVEAAVWLERSLREEWSDEDRSALDAWLNASPVHQLAYWRLEAAWNETYRLAALKSAQNQPMRPPSRAFGRTAFLRAAAGVAVLAAALIAGSVWLTPKNTRTEYSTALGEHKVLRLADGSQIELNTNTSLATSIGKHGRKVWLRKGEAYFQVNHDPARPFTVFTSDRQIVDIGTKFVVRRTSDTLRVAVLEGRVEFGSKNGKDSRELRSGDVAVASSKELLITSAAVSDIASELSWRHGRLVFHHTPLSEAAAEFNRYNGEKLAVADAEAGRITINGTFSTEDVHAFSRLAQAVLGLKVDTQGQTITISSKKNP